MENQEAPKDLLDKVQAAKAIVTVHSLLGVGMFQFRHQDQLKQSMEFLTALHTQVLDECLLHPDCEKVQDLVDYKAEQERQAQLKELMDQAQSEEE